LTRDDDHRVEDTGDQPVTDEVTLAANSDDRMEDATDLDAGPEDTGHPAESGESSSRRRSLRGIVVGLVALVVLLALVLPGVLTLRPAYYNRYAATRESIDQWRSSTHARMSCGGCHLEPGLRSHIEYGFKAVPAFYSQLFQGPTENNLLGSPSSAACRKCHTIDRRVSADGDLLIPHLAHIDKLDIECSQCHANLVHANNEKGLNRPPMTGCVASCHNGKTATDQCNDCHTGKQVPDSHKQGNWLKIHQDESKKQDCTSCHGWSPDYCDQCHSKRPDSHSGNWKKNHSKRASAEGDEGCLFCHERAFCEDCH